MKHCHRYFKALHSISLPSIVGWPISASLSATCRLLNNYFYSL